LEAVTGTDEETTASAQPMPSGFKQAGRQTTTFTDDELFALTSKLHHCAWLPAAPPPEGWPVCAPWCGASFNLCNPKEVRLASEDALVGMVRPLVGISASPPRSVGNVATASGDANSEQTSKDPSHKMFLSGKPVGFTKVVDRPPRVLVEVLGLEEKPNVDLLREQLAALEKWTTSLSEGQLESFGPWVTKTLYDHLYPAVFNDKCWNLNNEMRLWVPSGGFVPLDCIARQTIEFPPYLVRAPTVWRDRVSVLWEQTKETFTVKDCVQALHCIKKDQVKADATVLTTNQLDIAVRLVMAITDMLHREGRVGVAGAVGDEEEEAKVLMPTTDSWLHPVEECVFNNMTWLPDVETSEVSLGSFFLVHAKISHSVAHACGCRGLSLVYAREATEMAGADWFEAAGQSEPMTTRLKNLLKDYPADISMFKEMIQNADDAGASKVHFVWDWRNHRRQSLLTPDMSKWQ